MNVNWKTLIQTVQATAIGLVLLSVFAPLTIVIFLVALPYLNPPPDIQWPCPEPYENEVAPPCEAPSGMWPPNAMHNVMEMLIGVILLYFVSVWFSSFVSGYYLNSGRRYIESHYWQSIISGFIVGSAIPFTLVGFDHRTDVEIIVLAGSSALFALFGYGTAQWRRGKMVGKPFAEV